MSDVSIEVIVTQSWNVLVFSNKGEADGELLVDDSFDDYSEALLHAAQCAERYGTDITYAQ